MTQRISQRKVSFYVEKEYVTEEEEKNLKTFGSLTGGGVMQAALEILDRSKSGFFSNIWIVLEIDTYDGVLKPVLVTLHFELDHLHLI